MFRLIRWLQLFFGITPKYIVRTCAELPEVPENYIVYLEGEAACYWLAAMVCPCGCGALIQLSLAKSGHPRWTVEVRSNKTVSLHPSVHRTTGCRSHFFLKNGKVIWCLN
ncbi:DUF6527 family protein [Chitinimonas naiadis]